MTEQDEKKNIGLVKDTNRGNGINGMFWISSFLIAVHLYKNIRNKESVVVCFEIWGVIQVFWFVVGREKRGQSVEFFNDIFHVEGVCVVEDKVGYEVSFNFQPFLPYCGERDGIRLVCSDDVFRFENAMLAGDESKLLEAHFIHDGFHAELLQERH